MSSKAPTVFDAYANTHPGLESLVAAELKALKLAVTSVEPGGVSFRANLVELATANLHLRVASRVLVRVARFHARLYGELERHLRKIDWTPFLNPGDGVHFRVTSKKSKLFHEGGIGDRFAAAASAAVPGLSLVVSRSKAADLESDPNDLPDVQRFVVRFFRDECALSVDSSGVGLHRRGYRQEGGIAPLRETLAAALLGISGWDGTGALVDPFCGSGTIPIEAALIARNMAPGLNRRFAMERWPLDRGERLVERIRQDLRRRVLPAAGVPILGTDRDAGAIETARRNAAVAGVAADISFSQAALSLLSPPSDRGWIVTNPPYGVRVGDRQRLRNLYAQLGNVIRKKCAGWRVCLLSPSPMLDARAGLPWREAARTENGGIPVRVMVFDPNDPSGASDQT